MKGIVLSIGVLALLLGCTEEQQNRISRVGITWMEGDYTITFAEGSHLQQWNVYGGKVTAEPEKGYYYFWAKKDRDSKKFYVQTPISRSYIVEMP
ncbi:MAG: hypothetical protein HQL48_01800 [Gammaproteobacteria bacterium]|nr:hypothetical protein [Gammaproteobacteria bacterium]